MTLDLDAIESALRAHPCGRCIDGQVPGDCPACVVVARRQNAREIPPGPLKHRGKCTSEPYITCAMCKGTGKRMPSHGVQTLALIAELRQHRAAGWTASDAVATLITGERDKLVIALRNVLALATRLKRGTKPDRNILGLVSTHEVSENCDHLIRFCREAGVEPTILRGTTIEPAPTDPNRPRAKR